jgi:two-component system sensor histidine kinase UhpB
MSLRLRLIGLVLIGLSVSLALGGVVILVIASQSVRTEMRSALAVARQTIDQGLRELNRSPDPGRELHDLVASFDGSRHLRVRLRAAGVPGEIGGSDALPDNTPRWFVWLVGVAPESDRIPVALGGDAAEIVVTTDPANEIREVWDEMNGTLIVLALFGGQVIPLIYLSTGRALRPLDRLAAAMEQVGRGDYEVRVDGPLTPELARLRDSFNRMAERLAAADGDNRRLNEQMATLQEEERSDIARDLHDEFGPLLFAINVDIANMSRLAREHGAGLLLSHVESIAATAHLLQRQVRGMLGRLRQTGGVELGLAEALEELIEFWRRRSPRINYRLSIEGSCDSFGTAIDTTIYRIVQEGLSNAVRHGNPRRIAIAIRTADAGGCPVLVSVDDDGSGMRAGAGLGYGLIGMEERVRGLGGRLTFSNSPNGGFALTAALPIARKEAPPMPAAADVPP